MLLYEPLHQRLSRFVQTQVWDAEEAKDLISETVLCAYERFEQLQQEEAFLSYLFSIASNLVKQKIRRKKFMGIFNLYQAEQMPGNNDAQGRIMLFELNRALEKLPEKQRQAIVLYEISGVEMGEIGGILGLSEAGVKTSIHRARKKLSELLEHNPGIYYERRMGYEK